jgi:hypothetical protein
VLPPVTLQGATLNDNKLNGGLMVSGSTITIAGITAADNQGKGLELVTRRVGSTGGVVVSGALGLNRFSDNKGFAGLYIEAQRNVSLVSVNASRNTGVGIYITGEATSNVNLVNVVADNNRGTATDGIYIETRGTVVLNNTHSSYNTGRGLYIKNRDAEFSRLVRINNGTFVENGYHGIEVRSAGAITLSNLTASQNGGRGALLSNEILNLPAQVAQGVTVIKSTFDGNTNEGLYIESKNKITLTSINASGNGADGIRAGNQGAPLASAIVLTGTNRLLHNGGRGSALLSNGIVTVSGVSALWNSNTGIFVTSGPGINVSNVMAEGNGNNGVYLFGGGTYTLRGITSIRNGSSGAYIHNSNGKVYIYSGIFLANTTWGAEFMVSNPATDVYIAPSVVFLGNFSGDKKYY